MNPAHGTVPRYRKHLRDGTEPCADCRRANTERMTEYRRTNKDYAEAMSALAAAKMRTVTRLSKVHPEAWATILDQEMDISRRKGQVRQAARLRAGRRLAVMFAEEFNAMFSEEA